MDLHALQQFLVVAELEHLSGAAERLRVAQPSLSRTIARLESELGAPLFDRGGRLKLNEAGRRFYEHVERSLGELEAGRRAVAELARGGVGSVCLASETFLTVTGPLAAFKRAHPDVDVQLYQLPASDMHRALHAREVDLCVASQPIPGDGLDSVPLHDEQVWLATPPGHRLAGRSSVAVGELRDEPFVAPRPGHWQRRLLDRLFEAVGLKPRIVCEGDELAATAALVISGMGLTLIPAMALQTDIRVPVACIAVDDDACRRTLTLHRAADARVSTAARLMHTALVAWPWDTADDQPRH
ncbi:LysR family transcriptional regulator [Streptomyces sp. WAC05374]|uniref:LysR family transcriptional regulator n=1 Tax=Streptomyces sp. WAC05374 TaxID=2487420 RepID=UPI000F89C198|nr:LysR family transcriptional regulator [Streptomyces sp. WAC05374]RST19654.1 LysR family transcriptional regulator [Streptomyces sp. WAC05374]TDF50008.1 LysR family transcriptional regulator [Streptomyces sp. WAC05374]TDF57735.1 LysR family transcriptional regulator [Streptomyces sp. WAC05374]TDF60263.1 LysR family transcriptional regulator [Streptomyces sp. WAC05374]